MSTTPEQPEQPDSEPDPEVDDSEFMDPQRAREDDTVDDEEHDADDAGDTHSADDTEGKARRGEEQA